MESAKIVHLPTTEEVEEAKETSRTLSKYANADRVNLSIKGSNGENDNLVLPGPVLQLLLDVLSEMSKGNAVNIVPLHQELSTQEAANILNVSRPYLVKLLNQDEIPYKKVGTHRRLLLKDLLEYKQKLYSKREKALDELITFSQEQDMGY